MSDTPTTTVADKYVLLKRIATGGMAEVFLARQMGLDGFEKLVVLKRVLPNLVSQSDFLEMFLDEARTAADLRHPNVVNIFEIGKDRGTYYMVMEFLSGQNVRGLQRHFENEEGGGLLPLGHALQIVLGVANGLHYAHQKTDLRGKPLGIVHRDVSPQNIVVTYDGAIKIVDFGIAKAASATTDTAPGIVKGKFEYMSPEQADGQVLDARSDQFSLGIVLFELTTGQRLFNKATDFVTIRSVSDCDIRPPSYFMPEYPPGLEQIVMKALSKELGDRYASCADFAADVEEFLTAERIPHSAARLGRYMQEIFVDELHEDSVIPMTEVLFDDKDKDDDEPEFESFDDDLPATTIAAVKAKASSDSIPVPPALRKEIERTSEAPVSNPTPEPAAPEPVGEPAATPADNPWDQSSADSFLGALSKALPAAADQAQTATATEKTPPGRQMAGSPADPSAAASDGTFLSALGPYLLQVAKVPRIRTNLVDEPGLFVGRESDLKSIHKLFGRGERLVSVLGPGGAGKTRLAQKYGVTQLAAQKENDSFAVWFCDLTEAHTDEAICRAIGAAMSVPLTTGRTSEDTIELLGGYLSDAPPMLMILDNFDQIVDFAPATLGRWLAQAPHIRFLVTSRELLRIPGEVAYDLKPLALPEAADDIETSAAVQLFVHRVRAIEPNYKMAQGEGKVIGEIVRLLDGIPLAIELAAGRVGLLSLTELRDRITEVFPDVLAGGKRGAHSRQATLRGTIDWSWNLLTPGERIALAQCSVFRGGFTVDAAEAVIDLSEVSDETLSPLDAVQRLRDKSLLRTRERRLAHYVSIREYATEHLEAGSSTEENAQGRHAAYYLRVAGDWTDKLYGQDGQMYRGLLTQEIENLMAVANRGLARKPLTPPAAKRAVQAVLALDKILSIQGPFVTHSQLLDAAVNATAIPGVDPLLRAELLQARGKARRARGDHTDALADLAEAVSIARRKKNRRIEAAALVYLANLFEEKGRYGKAQIHFDEALRIARELKDKRTESSALRLLGVLHLERGQLTDAASVLEKSIALAQEVGDQRLVGMALGNIAGLYRELDQVEEAQETYERALSIFMDIGDRRRQGIYIGYLGLLHVQQGKTRSALAHFIQAVKMAREAGDRRTEGFFLAWLGAAEAKHDRVDEAHVSLTAATQRLHALRDVTRIACAELLHGHLDLARARHFANVGDNHKAEAYRRKVAQRLDAVRDTDKPTGVALLDRSDEIRLAARTLQLELQG